MGDLRAILVKFLPSHGAVSLFWAPLPPANTKNDTRTDIRSSRSLRPNQIILAFHDLRHAISTSRILQRKTVYRLGADVKLRTSFVAKTTVEQVSSRFSSLLDSTTADETIFSRSIGQLVGDTKQGMQLVGENDGGVMVTMLDTQGGKLSLLGLQATREFSFFLFRNEARTNSHESSLPFLSWCFWRVEELQSRRDSISSESTRPFDTLTFESLADRLFAYLPRPSSRSSSIVERLATPRMPFTIDGSRRRFVSRSSSSTSEEERDR